MTKPFPYQADGVRRMLAFASNGSKVRCLLADEMGLGKSLQALFVAKELKAWPLVVVCPASVKWNWRHECVTHLGMGADVLEGRRARPFGALDATPKIVVINYDILTDWMPIILSLGPKMVVLDECHYLLSRWTQRTKSCRTLCKSVSHVMALSGTPLVNRPAELWPTLNILRRDLFPSFFTYGFEYCGAVKKPWAWEFKGQTNLPQLHKLLGDNLMVRRLKADVLKDLPAKSRYVIPLPIRKRKSYEKAEQDFLAWLAENDPHRLRSAVKAERLVHLGYLKRLAARLKMRYVLDWIDNFLAECDRKLLVFAIHKRIIKRLRERYEGRCVVVDGSVTGRKRQLAVEQFQRNPRTRLFIGQIRAAGVGLNLTAASDVAFVELDWTPGAMVQAEDRCHRIGTKKAVSVWYLVAKDTVETKLAKILQMKKRTSNAVLDGTGRGDKLDIFDLLTKELQKGVQDGRPLLSK